MVLSPFPSPNPLTHTQIYLSGCLSTLQTNALAHAHRLNVFGFLGTFYDTIQKIGLLKRSRTLMGGAPLHD